MAVNVSELLVSARTVRSSPAARRVSPRTGRSWPSRTRRVITLPTGVPDIRDGAAVGRRGSLDGESVNAVGFVAQSHSERPGLRFDQPHGQVQESGDGGKRPPWTTTENTTTTTTIRTTVSRRDVRGEQVAAEQDRHGTFEPGEEHKVALVGRSRAGRRQTPTRTVGSRRPGSRRR